jgi:hypothetical protein
MDALDDVHPVNVGRVMEKLSDAVEQAGLTSKFPDLSNFVSTSNLSLQQTGEAPLQVHGSKWKWKQHYSVLSFLLNGQLHAVYKRLSTMLGFPPCSSTQWHRIEPHVTELADLSCQQVRQAIVNRGDKEKWVASYDGFYQTRGHYSNNSSANLHDHVTGNIAWFAHRIKRGPGRHIWWS